MNRHISFGLFFKQKENTTPKFLFLKFTGQLKLSQINLPAHTGFSVMYFNVVYFSAVGSTSILVELQYGGA